MVSTEILNAVSEDWSDILTVCSRLEIPTFTKKFKSSKAVAQVGRELDRMHRDRIIQKRWRASSTFGGTWEYRTWHVEIGEE